MNGAGMVRRIDELGRVVIPKEIRRNMRIKEGEELEVFLGDDDTVVLRKHSPLKAYLKIAKRYRKVLENLTQENIIITDKDYVVSSRQKDEIGQKISKKLESIINARRTEQLSVKITAEGEEDNYLVCPIIVNGDVLGSIIMRCNNDTQDSHISLMKIAVELIVVSIE